MLKNVSVKNRSYRAFDESVRITREQLLELVDIARFAPSSVNAQPFKFWVRADKESCDTVFPLTNWARLLKDYDGPAEGHRPTGYIVICTDKSLNPAMPVERFATDVGIVAQTIMLGAVEIGFGGCMIGNFSKEKLTEAIGLPDNLYPSLILALGKPDEEIILEDTTEVGCPAPYYRDANGVHHVPKRPLKEIVF